MVLVVYLAERETRSEHLLTFGGTEIDGFVLIFFEDSTITEPTNFKVRLSDYGLIKPISIFDPLYHDNNFLACNVLVGSYFVLFE